MKKLYALAMAFFAIITVSAQLAVQVTAPGVVKLTYGASNDYSIYGPGFEVPTFWIHVWSSAGDNSTGTMYDDSWGNSNVTMNWDATASAYVGTIDLNTKVFTNGNKVFAAGTTVSNLGFVFKNQQNGATQQSGDLLASDFGFTPTTLVVLGTDNTARSKKSFVSNGKLYTSHQGNIALTIYEMSGKLVKSFTSAANGDAIDLNVEKAGLYLVKITRGTETEVVKFAK